MSEINKIKETLVEHREQINAMNKETRLLLKLLNQEIGFLNENLSQIKQRVGNLSDNLIELARIKHMFMGAMTALGIIIGASFPLIVKLLSNL